MIPYEKCLEIILEKFSKEIYHNVIKSNWFPIGGFNSNLTQNGLIIFYTWRGQILKAQEIIKNAELELLYEFRFYKDTFNNLKENFYNNYNINIIDMLKLSKYVKLEEPRIADFHEYNFLEIDCRLESPRKENVLNHNVYFKEEFNIYAPTILGSYSKIGPDTYIQWFEEIRYIDDIERNVYLYNFYPFLVKYFDEIKGKLKWKEQKIKF